MTKIKQKKIMNFFLFSFSIFTNSKTITKTLEIDDMDVIVQIGENEVSIGSGMTLKSAFDTEFDFQFTIPDTIAYGSKTLQITSIGEYSFYKTNINKLFISKNVKTIKSSAFELCFKLDDIEVDKDNKYFISEENMLMDIEKTTLYHMSHEADQGMIPPTVTFFSDACFSASPIKTFQYLPKYKSIGEALFNGCRKLKKANLLKAKITKIPNRMFLNCPKLSDVIFPQTIDFIGDKAFKNTQITKIPDVNRYMHFGKAAFQNTLIRSANLFDANISILSAKLFSGCRQLEKIHLPDVLELINETTFRECTRLMKVVYRGAKEFTQENIFTSTYPKVYVYLMRYPWYHFCHIDVYPYNPNEHQNIRKVPIGMRGRMM